MPRPPAELRKLEEEEKRRDRAHRRLRRGQLMKRVAWTAFFGFLLLLATLLVARLVGFGLP